MSEEVLEGEYIAADETPAPTLLEILTDMDW